MQEAPSRTTSSCASTGDSSLSATLPLQAEILGQVDDAHPAAAEQVLDPITGELGADPRVVAHLHVRVLAFGGLEQRYDSEKVYGTGVTARFQARIPSDALHVVGRASARAGRLVGPSRQEVLPLLARQRAVRERACTPGPRLRIDVPDGPLAVSPRSPADRWPSRDRSIVARPPSPCSGSGPICVAVATSQRETAAPETSRPEARPETARTVPSRLNSRSSRRAAGVELVDEASRCGRPRSARASG